MHSSTVEDSLEQEQQRGSDHFTATDRRSLIELTQDVRYMREAVNDLRQAQKDSFSTYRSEVKELWAEFEKHRKETRDELDALKQFRWSMGGFSAGAGLVGGAIFHFIFGK